MLHAFINTFDCGCLIKPNWDKLGLGMEATGTYRGKPSLKCLSNKVVRHLDEPAPGIIVIM
jgi:hypothetical protein